MLWRSGIGFSVLCEVVRVPLVFAGGFLVSGFLGWGRAWGWGRGRFLENPGFGVAVGVGRV